MIRSLTLVAASLLLSTTHVTAQQRHAGPSIPSTITVPAGISPAQLHKKMQQVMHAAYGTPASLQKTTAGNERLAAVASYDHSQSPGNDFVDSLRFTYSGLRTSAFDFYSLDYDVYNSADIPSPFPSGGFVNYDTMRSFNPPGSSNSFIIGLRNYNAAGKVVVDENPDYVTFFEYDAQNRLKKNTVVEYNAVTSTWDSSYRDFYSYDASGYLVRDSSENWDPGTLSFQPGATIVYTNNAAGYPVRATIDFSFGPISLTVLQFDILYNAGNKPIRTILKAFDGTGLENNFKDTMGYSGTMPVYNNSYTWDTTAVDWTLVYKERRRLNSSLLPDSVWMQDEEFGVPVDTTILKLAYNAQGNPVYMHTYFGASNSPELEQRWYYEPTSGVGVAAVAPAKALMVYPNPATDILYLKGVTGGRYMIYNATGQLLQAGGIQAASGLPVGSLPPGLYTISLQDQAGTAYTAQFIRQ